MKFQAAADICSFCLENICSPAALWGYHHTQLLTLDQSAASCCIFCTTLIQDIKRQVPEQDLAALSWPLYRWSIHKAAKIRETSDVISIIFRPRHPPPSQDPRDDGNTLPDRTFYLFREDDLGRIPTRTELGDRTDCEETWTQIRTWMQNCEEHHPDCKPRTARKKEYPTRLLDIGEIGVDQGETGSMRVVETREKKISGPYVTLSHSWGPKPDIIEVTAEHLDYYKTVGLKMTHPKLSNNFREGIRVARRLGVRYIWMDSICILQHNDDDFKAEAKMMHVYYKNSFCNIGAAASSRPQQGLFRDRNIQNSGVPYIPSIFVPEKGSEIFGSEVRYIVPATLWEQELLLNPLYTRAWVFQERMLAPRMLHFSHGQVFFECSTLSCCETIPDRLPPLIDMHRSATDRNWRRRLLNSASPQDLPLAGPEDLSIEGFWNTAVNTYTRCLLSKGKDKLLALSGIHTVVKEFLNDEAYGWGLWADNLEEQLAWNVVDCIQMGIAGDKLHSQRVTPIRFASWTWASVDGVIELRDRLITRDYRVKDHDGNPISFDVGEDNSPPAVPDVYNTGVGKADEGDQNDSEVKKAPTVAIGRVSPTQPKQMPSEPSIKLSASVMKGQVRWDPPPASRWLLSPTKHDSNTQEPWNDIIEVFPDELPPGVETSYDCQFTVLTYSKIAVAESSDEEASEDENFYEDYDKTYVHEAYVLADEDSEDETNPQGQNFTLKGVGLTLKEETPGHFYRTGSLQFTGLPKQTFDRFEQT